jgi:hypothetical protein
VLQLGGGGVGQEREELVRLVRAGRHPQRLHGQAGVTHPGVAVVPVALAADGLRQRRGRCRHDRPGRLERQRPQHPAGMVHQLLPGSLVVLVDGRPGTPSLHGVTEPGGDLSRGPGDQRRASHLAVAEREDSGLACGQADVGRRRVAAQVKRERCAQHQPVSAAPGSNPPRDRYQDRVDEAVLRAGRVADLRFDFTAVAGQLAEQHARRFRTQVVAALVAADREGVGEHGGAARRGEGRFQHHRLVHISAAGLELACRPDHESPTGRVKQAAEHRRPVEAREAQPVHRAVPADQCRRAAVRQ